jgi:hypothetical protein
MPDKDRQYGGIGVRKMIEKFAAPDPEENHTSTTDDVLSYIAKFFSHWTITL